MRKLIYVMVAFFLLGCSSETITDTQVKEETLLKGKPIDKLKAVVLTPTAVNNNPVGRIMEEPQNYTGELPVYTDAYTDWDLDGSEDDLVVTQYDCYFPWAKGWIEVWIDGNIANKVIVSYGVRWATQLVGFVDVDNDGDQDLILRYAKYYPYNTPDAYEYSEYTYGLNSEGQYPLSPAEVIASLEVSEVPNGNGAIDVVKWDLSGYGLTNMSSHVWFGSVNGVNPQTSTYGPWGVSGSYFERNATNRIRFANMGDECSDVEIFFEL